MSHTLPDRWKVVSLAGLTLLLAGLTVGALVGAGLLAPATGPVDPGPENVSEPAAEEPVPERGDPWFEAAAADGSWISYVNPRDEYRTPYLGDGSSKVCTTLVNEAGDPIMGKTVANTTVTVPMGDSVAWHSHADPFVTQYPLTDHYERPLDADQFGVSDLPQGDGYLDSHCIEIHGLSEEGDSVEYGEAVVEGEHADRIEVVGYIQQEPAGTGWDSSVDPVADAVSYEEAGGGWTFTPDSSHGQVTVVLQLVDDTADDDEGDGDGGYDEGSENGTDDSSSDSDGDDGDGSDGDGEETKRDGDNNGDADDTETDGDGTGADDRSGDGSVLEDDPEDDETAGASDDAQPGFGAGVAGFAIISLVVAVIGRRRASS
ncbi:PGF-CTERM sorting domain-containing protein [Natronosalvus halobius]|uniref:PGF-CTERM sorting domain-containing protein n=1 Tax=Natronosalvus halobius TaxID=2953746 RepID=UPI00209C92B9|nr:PGF-CTERM sorting domain-containing protein [Natronosalvus halobius]USZ70492.1 PGF-CTERM sorting domain-containing protein [Natronosalvus halobius]